MTKVLFISDNSDGGNWGCYATGKELRNLINENSRIEESIFLNDLKHKHLEFNPPKLCDLEYVASEYKKIVTANGSYPERLYNYGIKATMHFWDYLPKTASQFEPKAQQFPNKEPFDKFLSAIDDVDHVIINGEGSIHGDRRKSQILLFLAYVAKCEYGVPTHIVNHTLQIDTPRLEKIIDLVYPKIDTVVFRDPLSVKQYNSKIGTGNVIAGADAAWLFDDFLSVDQLNNLQQSGGLSVWSPDSDLQIDFNSEYICVGGGSGFRQSDEIVANGFSTLLQLMQDEIVDGDIVLTAAASSDETFMLKVSENTGLPLIKLNNDVRVAASVISNANLYLGGRWHPTIFALLGGTQIVSFQGNTFKIQAVKEQLGSDNPVFDTSQLYSSPQKILNSVKFGIETGFENAEIGEDEIKEFRKNAKKNTSHVFNY